MTRHCNNLSSKLHAYIGMGRARRRRTYTRPPWYPLAPAVAIAAGGVVVATQSAVWHAVCRCVAAVVAGRHHRPFARHVRSTVVPRRRRWRFFAPAKDHFRAASDPKEPGVPIDRDAARARGRHAEEVQKVPRCTAGGGRWRFWWLAYRRVTRALAPPAVAAVLRVPVRVRLRRGEVVGAPPTRQRHQTCGGSLPARFLRRFRSRRVSHAPDRRRAAATADGCRTPASSQLDGLCRRFAVDSTELVLDRPGWSGLRWRLWRSRSAEIACGHHADCSPRGGVAQILTCFRVTSPTTPPALVARVVHRSRLRLLVPKFHRHGVAVGHGSHQSCGHCPASINRVLSERLSSDRSQDCAHAGHTRHAAKTSQGKVRGKGCSCRLNNSLLYPAPSLTTIHGVGHPRPSPTHGPVSQLISYPHVIIPSVTSNHLFLHPLLLSVSWHLSLPLAWMK